MNNLYRVNSGNVDNRGEDAPHKNKLSFGKMKDNTIKSLNEVEFFWNNFNSFWKYIKLYKILK